MDRDSCNTQREWQTNLIMLKLLSPQADVEHFDLFHKADIVVKKVASEQ
jgi:hypothetical protein